MDYAVFNLMSLLTSSPVTCIPDDNDDAQTELLTLQEDSGAKMKFETESLIVFWSSMAASYPNLCDLAFRHLLPFSSTYSCEAAFSQLLHIKTKYRNRLEVKHDLRCALSETKPRIKKLVENLQHHPSHWVEWGIQVKETWTWHEHSEANDLGGGVWVCVATEGNDCGS